MRKKINMKGSMTVEAAFISTMIISLIILVIYFDLYMYNRTVIQSYSTYLANLASQSAFKFLDIESKTLNKGAEYQNIMNETWEEHLNQQIEVIKKEGIHEITSKMMLGTVKDFSLTYHYNSLINKIECTVLISAQTRAPITLFGKNSFDINIEKVAVAYDPILYIWKKDMIYERSGRK